MWRGREQAHIARRGTTPAECLPQFVGLAAAERRLSLKLRVWHPEDKDTAQCAHPRAHVPLKALSLYFSLSKTPKLPFSMAASKSAPSCSVSGRVSAMPP